MKRPTPQQQGRDYEAELAARYGGEAVPGSGASPRFKLDWRRGVLLVSAKFTTARSYRVTADDLHEMVAGAQGPGGRGNVPMMAIKMDGFPDDVFLVRGQDLRAILAEEVAVSFSPSKRDQKLAAARGA